MRSKLLFNVLRENKFGITEIKKQPLGCSIKEGISKSFAMFTGKRLCWSLLLIKFQALRPCNFIKKRLQHRCFPVNIAKFLRKLILKNICQRLPLEIRLN